MRITDLLSKESISLNAQAFSKTEAIDKLIELMKKTGNLTDPEEYKNCVLEREKLGTTGVGEGVAIPHAKTKSVLKAGLSAMVVKDGVDFEAMDGKPSRLLFLIAAPDTEENIHLDVLGRLSILLMNESFRENLINAKNTEEFCEMINKAESEKFGDVQKTQGKYKILAVTACPTGIAHTYMAAEALEEKAKQLGVSIKVETNGSGGAKNVLTKEDIKNADCIIVAADKNIDMARFDGKRVIQTNVAKGIHKAKELIEEAMSGKAPIYNHTDSGLGDETDEKEGVGRQIYKHLMNGVSHMLPFVIGGGILIALAFLFDDFKIDPSNFGKNTPLAALLKTIGEYSFGFMLPVLAGFIAMSIGDRPALAVGFVGGLMAKEGGAGFLGALVAGFAAGYIIVGLRKLFAGLPKSLEGTKPVLIYPLLGVLLIGVGMTFVINPPMAAFNKWISDALSGMSGTSKILLGLILGGMMSIDFGGPINKAAYLFGTASLATGQYEIMAAVMVGGMVPPLAIALCTVFFKNRFTEKERQSGITNFIMGLSFITEGAIPFAASDPLRVIPACAIGSATAGALSMVFGCSLMAPHGGIFVFPVVGQPLLYLLALCIGSVVGMLILAVLKKPVEK
ncbi:MAG: fructose-specific PTS transporter subunit EIIC [Clostridia bacterium]|nr:fructose-specific PTS transporter subunit EIIC [Clostridia bacterium]